VSMDLKEHVLNSVLDVLHTRFHALHEDVCTEIHSYFAAVASPSGTRDFERLDGFTESQRHARFCAGLIAAIHSSEVRTLDGASLVEDFEGFDDILKLASQPAGLIAQGEGLEALRATSELVLVEDDTGPMETDDGLWHCPQCDVSELHTDPNAIGVYGLSRPTCGQNPGKCWCEKIDPNVKYCKLCVNFFRRRHCRRPANLERKRISNAKKRKSEGDGLASPDFKRNRETALVPVAPISPHTTAAKRPPMDFSVTDLGD